MPKKTLFISAALTAFILVVAASVVSAYQQASVVEVAAEPIPTAVEVVAMPTAIPTATEVALVTLTPQEAAMVAANYLEQTDLYSVESVIWEGVEAYKVVFSSGDIVYVSLTGEIIGTEEPPVVYVSNNNNNNNNATSTRDHDDDHDYDHHDNDHDEHEDHDDD